MVEEFSQRRYCDMQSVAPFTSFEENLGQDVVRGKIPEQLFNSNRQINIGDLFIGRDRYLWIYKQITVPQHKDGYTVTGLFDFGKTGPGNTLDFESLLYVNGKPFQGVGTNHKEVNLEEFAGQTITLIFMLWTGLEGGGKPRELVHRISTADVGYLHHSTDKLYYYGKAVVGGLEMLDKDSTDRTKLVDLFDSALDYINFDEDEFYRSSDEALRVLSANLKKYEKHSNITVNCVGHTHIDVAWLWRLKHTREKAMRSFSTVNRLMNDYDEYRFLQTQPQLYDYIKTDKPEIYQYIKNRVSEGKWEADGGMWLEADCNIPSGESLVRQLTQGIKFYKEQFAHDCEFLWLPDVFGYSWALQQILNQCNIKTFMTTKISWNQYNLIPNDIFRWRGLEGSEILTYFITTPCEKYDPDTFFSTYNGEIEPYSVLGNWKMFKNKDLTNETLICYGYGDGGGGVNREMLEMRRVMDELPGFPNVKTSTAGEFFDKLHENVDNTTKYVPK